MPVTVTSLALRVASLKGRISFIKDRGNGAYGTITLEVGVALVELHFTADSSSELLEKMDAELTSFCELIR